MRKSIIITFALLVLSLEAQEQFYFKTLINGKKVEFVVDDKGLYASNKEYSKNDSCVISSNCQIPSVKINEVKPCFNVILNIYGKGYCEDFDVENLDYVTVGVQEYSFQKSKGYVITYTDEKGMVYSSTIKKQSTLASFNIVSVKDYEDSFEITNKIIEGTLTCTLYNVKDASKTIELKAATFKVLISKY